MEYPDPHGTSKKGISFERKSGFFVDRACAALGKSQQCAGDYYKMNNIVGTHSASPTFFSKKICNNMKYLQERTKKKRKGT